MNVKNQDSGPTRISDRILGITFGIALFAAVALYFLFYSPGISQVTESGGLPTQGIFWLKLHITVYWISYFMYIAGLLLAVIISIRKATTRFPWVEAGTIVATVLTIIGLITGILYSKPAWNVWWVWDSKHVVSLVNTLILFGIAFLVAFSRIFFKGTNRNIALVVLLCIAVATCVWSLLIGFARNIHPQWFLNLFVQ